MPEKPYAPSCDRNRDPILEVLREVLDKPADVLELGSGTGQHAVYFAHALPHLCWQTSERAEECAGVRVWLDEAQLPNTPPPLILNVAGDWPKRQFDAVFTANTLHIMSWPQVETLFARLPAVLRAGGHLIVYGPFNYGGHFSSDSNAAFEQWLKARGAHMGIRDFEAVDALAQQAGLRLVEDRTMPANNRCVIWSRR